jgi:hypothetical protein
MFTSHESNAVERISATMSELIQRFVRDVAWQRSERAAWPIMPDGIEAPLA